jgi:hypothetical protein
LEEAERAALPTKPVKPAARGEDKKAAKRTGNLDDLFKGPVVAPGLTATNIDDALDALTLATGGEGEERKAVAGIDRHPERRQKAALAAFEDRRLPELRKEHPGLRLQQYKDLIFKEFQKVSLRVAFLSDNSPLRIHLIRSMHRITQQEQRSETWQMQRNERSSNGLQRNSHAWEGSFLKVLVHSTGVTRLKSEYNVMSSNYYNE